jgi:uncharacterized cupredoxin-like copper-binding protein
MGNVKNRSRWGTLRLGLAGALVVLLAAACGRAAPATQVSVSLGEYFVRPSSASVAAGQVEFVAKNEGALEHELVVLKTDLAPDALKMEAAADEVDEAASGQLVGEIEGIGPGTTANGTFTLTAGKHVLFCNIPGHYRLGMRAAFEVR